MCVRVHPRVTHMLCALYPAAQLGLHVENPYIQGLGLLGLLSWSALWVVVARRLGRSGQLTGDNDVY